MKETFFFWEMSGEVDKTDRTELGKCIHRTELGKCIHLYDETQGNTSAFDRKLSWSGARKIYNNKIIGSKEEDRQEEADVILLLLRMDTQI